MRNPYVTGYYVVGRKHYGRQYLLDALLHGEANAYWVIGTRRIGKTSLLRQLEVLALSPEQGGRFIPIFWDMQGCNTFASLSRYLTDALQERFDLLGELGLPPEVLQDENLLTLLPALRRAVRATGRELLLLCDETEVLIHVARQEPEAAQRLHAELTRGAGLRVVAVSTRQIYELHEVCRNWPTSPFLAGFNMAYTLGSLDDETARALITQAQTDEPVRADPDVIAAICELTNRHPYLIQLLCSRLFQVEGYLRPVEAADLAVDPLLAGFLSNDFSQLAPAEQRLVWAVYDRGQVNEAALAEATQMELAEVHAILHEIEPLGYVRRQDGQLMVGNQFLGQWLAQEQRRTGRPSAPPGSSAPSPTGPTPDMSPIAPPAVRDAAARIEQLNAKRTRLMELEVIRARQLLDVSPAVLAEIRQTEQEIERLLTALGVTT